MACGEGEGIVGCLLVLVVIYTCFGSALAVLVESKTILHRSKLNGTGRWMVAVERHPPNRVYRIESDHEHYGRKQIIRSGKQVCSNKPGVGRIIEVAESGRDPSHRLQKLSLLSAVNLKSNLPSVSNWVTTSHSAQGEASSSTLPRFCRTVLQVREKCRRCKTFEEGVIGTKIDYQTAERVDRVQESSELRWRPIIIDHEMKEIQVAGRSKYEVLEDVAGDVIYWLKSVKLWKGAETLCARGAVNRAFRPRETSRDASAAGKRVAQFGSVIENNDWVREALENREMGKQGERAEDMVEDVNIRGNEGDIQGPKLLRMDCDEGGDGRWNSSGGRKGQGQRLSFCAANPAMQESIRIVIRYIPARAIEIHA
ncbi:hypothetical protein C8J57DRAFT_1570921 [Mycena rebaudengoi]|nr:hypothetical protein C8J57DRAFT_1570921 [Mycena rebaudengoi]